MTPALNYESLVQSMGLEVLHSIVCGSYSGDQLILVQDEDQRLGLLVFGYGSCSGCDSLQACNSLDDLSELRDRLYRDIAWFGSAAEFDAIRAKWEESNSWMAHDDEVREAYAEIKKKVKLFYRPTT